MNLTETQTLTDFMENISNYIFILVLIIGIVTLFAGIIYGIYKYRKTKKFTTLLSGVLGGCIIIVTAFLMDFIIEIINSPNAAGSIDFRALLYPFLLANLFYAFSASSNKQSKENDENAEKTED